MRVIAASVLEGRHNPVTCGQGHGDGSWAVTYGSWAVTYGSWAVTCGVAHPSCWPRLGCAVVSS